jgi:LysM repeat protein
VHRVCPLLGLVADGRTAVDGADPGHRCHAESPPLLLERQQQVAVCLTDAHLRCERFLAHAARNGRAAVDTVRFGDGFVSTRMLLTPEPAWRGIAGRARRARRGPVALVAGGTVLAALAGASAVATGALDRMSLQLAAVPPSSPSAAATPRPTAVPTPPPTPLSGAMSAAASPTATPTPSATPLVTPEPTAAPTPTPPRVYVVAEGDTLSEIAASFGVTAAAIQAANGLSDPDQINVGQQLIIP